MEDLIDRIGNHTHFLSRGSYPANRHYWNSIIHRAATKWPERESPKKIGASKRPFEEESSQPSSQVSSQESENGSNALDGLLQQIDLPSFTDSLFSN